MKKKHLFIAIALIGAACVGLGACSAGGGWSGGGEWNYNPQPDHYVTGNYDYNSIIENGFKNTADEASSYFSLDRNTATYSLVRRQLNDGHSIAPDSVRVEEMINYFDYDFTAPTDKAVAVSSCCSSGLPVCSYVLLCLTLP